MFRKIALGAYGLAVLVVIAVLVIMVSRYEPDPDKVSAVATPIPDSPLSTNIQALISQQLAAYRAAQGLPSISAAIGIDGALAYAEAVGYADLSREMPATPESLYRIGSVSKSITAVALGRLMETGQIDVDAPFHDYVPSFPRKHWPFTLRQLASHTAGIRHYRPWFFAKLKEHFHDIHYDSVADSLVLVADDPLLFEPGTAYFYSSYGFNMLSAAMAAAAGMPFRELLARDVFDPAGMPTARAEDALNPHPASVGYYLHLGGTNYRSPDTDNSYKIAGGGMIATPSELVAFGNALLDGKLIRTETRAELFTPAALANGTTEPQNYGLGFHSNHREVAGRSYREIGHGGASVGGRTAFLMYPEVGLVIAVTTNVSPLASGVSPYVNAYAIADLLIPLLGS